MSFLSPCRAALLQSSRRTSRISTANRSLLATQWYQQRHASSKHPKGFAPPTQDDLEELRERTVEFARREIPQDVAQAVDHTNEFPNDMWRKMGEAGFLGITADEDYGGLAMGYQAHCTVMEELSRASGKIEHDAPIYVNNVIDNPPGSIALSYAAHSQLCVNQLMLNGNEDQKARYLPGLISGEKIGALAMSEHTAGSDIVYAKTQPDAGSKGMTAFIVETDQPGFGVARKLDKLGMRGSNTGELTFDNVFVPKENVLGTVNRGTRVLMEGLDLERLVLSAGPIGLMKAALDVTLPYVHERKQFGEPLAATQFMQGKLSDMYTKYRVSSAFTYSVARAIDESHENPDIKTQDCAGAILYAAERATECGMDAIQCLGGMGYMNEMPAGRIMRDAKLYEIGAGTTEVRKIVIGRAFNREYGLR
jgi:isovaleryl-CoA dehydrogenase